jgi:hypothetical protein
VSSREVFEHFPEWPHFCSESVWHWALESACCSTHIAADQLLRLLPWAWPFGAPLGGLSPLGTSQRLVLPGDDRHMYARPPQARPRCTQYDGSLWRTLGFWYFNCAMSTHVCLACDRDHILYHIVVRVVDATGYTRCGLPCRLRWHGCCYLFLRKTAFYHFAAQLL